MPFSVRFDKDTATLHSALSGVLGADDVAAWEAALFAATHNLATRTRFQVIDDLQGYEVTDQHPAVHQLMRVVSPKFLAAHGFAVGFWRLYEQTPPPPTQPSVCWRVAHLHHDCDKMDRYNELLATETERFFCATDQAHAWLDID